MVDKAKYITNLQPGTLVAYKFPLGRVRSGKVLKVNADTVSVEDYDTTLFDVAKEHIIWVKTGARWPKEIFKELRRL